MPARSMCPAPRPAPGCSRPERSWTDYTATFRTKITTNQAGWMVRGQDAQHGYLFILNASNDTAGTPNVLQELTESGTTYKHRQCFVGNSDRPGRWHTVKEVVSGTTVTTFIDGAQLASSTRRPSPRTCRRTPPVRSASASSPASRRASPTCSVVSAERSDACTATR